VVTIIDKASSTRRKKGVAPTSLESPLAQYSSDSLIVEEVEDVFPDGPTHEDLPASTARRPFVSNSYMPQPTHDKCLLQPVETLLAPTRYPAVLPQVADASTEGNLLADENNSQLSMWFNAFRYHGSRRQGALDLPNSLTS
jgi:hypothetical protein